MTKREASRRIRIVARNIQTACEQARTQTVDPDEEWSKELAYVAMQLDGRLIRDLPPREEQR